jgi:fido (protein-threonine AMPylation protein)
MDKLLSWEPQNPIEAIEWHIAFEHIHPFADGNGRIGRLVYLRHSQLLDFEPVMWRAEDRASYYDLFRTDIDLDEKSRR